MNAVVSAVATGSCTSTSGGGDVLVSCGSPSTAFPQNKQNEPSVGVNPLDPTIFTPSRHSDVDGT
jgi:hypothetical protein